MTLDTNHLRQLLTEATPKRLGGYADFDNHPGAIILSGLNDEGEEVEVANFGANGALVSWLARLNNAAEELLDRSDALTEALRMLRVVHDVLGGAGVERETLSAFLARYPEEAA